MEDSITEYLDDAGLSLTVYTSFNKLRDRIYDERLLYYRVMEVGLQRLLNDK